MIEDPDGDGKWTSAFNPNLVVSFVRDEKGTVTALNLGRRVLPRVKDGE